MDAKIRHCEICGEAIDAERIEHQPTTRLCGVHAREIVKFGGEFITTVTQDSLQKRGSMKGNPGDVAVSGRVRNTIAVERLRDEFERGKA